MCASLHFVNKNSSPKVLNKIARKNVEKSKSCPFEDGTEDQLITSVLKNGQ